MTEYLDREDVLTAGSIAFGGELKVRDYGLLDAAVARPQATVYGVDAYPRLWDKAAALLQSLARNHALVDGNKRTAWAAAWTFLHINGVQLAADFDVDRAEDLMNEVATRDCDLDSIAAELAGFAAAQTG
ncbi:type II toxin-antitoxin system death-on-curing family toxin [Mycolicibacterium smegmatis]|uniref:Death-on-curing protein n=1 Tax=Mycolicibacterium smegmatis (strain MKD8) TaxID=1214915 RepID=A0A2U9PKR4_MYCSE|nr:type II toxin-antitoxin system death-on-curing family toxin [Mycolicibacterium smegmatis]AWT52276.1 death-on-curing protein [Mycolicibacterium smegmatis MKD8]MCP2627431.1 type II toxin-antitoxin system death-on-curing family toxin [Mycolicibacterium smegmatis]MDF1902968.1 type II toxin-antitoxin system death-on-curing family toxin [Mycolicibacterium smegmatis]MDF1909244.1 type II toxin-antitoxin system death-on-curing family toxin [Mycolicibacterium smegmatis]MDF1921423.1 type II toxin-anti